MQLQTHTASRTIIPSPQSLNPLNHSSYSQPLTHPPSPLSHPFLSFSTYVYIASIPSHPISPPQEITLDAVCANANEAIETYLTIYKILKHALHGLTIVKNITDFDFLDNTFAHPPSLGIAVDSARKVLKQTQTIKMGFELGSVYEVG